MKTEETGTLKAYNYAVKCHNETNHTYDNKPYSYHLKMVYDIALENINMIPKDAEIDVLSACWLHDTIEDTRQTYNDIKSNFNERVANLVYALTNEKGKTRKERANDKYYEGIKKTQYATFIKACDRLANIKYSKENGSSMFEKYKKENSEFVSKLHCPEYNGLFMEMYNLFNN